MKINFVGIAKTTLICFLGIFIISFISKAGIPFLSGSNLNESFESWKNVLLNKIDMYLFMSLSLGIFLNYRKNKK